MIALICVELFKNISAGQKLSPLPLVKIGFTLSKMSFLELPTNRVNPLRATY